MENFKQKAIISLISSYASQFATTVINLATKLIIARLIAPGDLGLYAKALFLLMGFEMLMDFGVTQHMARESHRPYGSFLLLRLTIAGILISSVELFGFSLRGWGSELPSVMRVMVIILAIKATSGVPNLYLERELLIHRSVLPQLLRLVTTGAVSVVFAKFGYGVWALVYGTIGGELMFAISMWASVRKRIPIELTHRHSVKLLWGSKYLFLISLMGFGLQQGDIAITGTLLSNTQVGYYAMALSLVVLLSKVVESAVYRVIYPLFCEYKHDTENLGRIFRQATLAVYALETPLYFYLLFNAPAIVPILLGKKWMPAAILMQSLSIYGIINPFCTFGNEVLRAKKQDSLLILSTALGAASLLGSGYFLTKYYGAIGMTLAHILVLGSIPVIISLYKSIREDFILLARQLAVVYAISLVTIAAASLSLSRFPYAQFLVAGLLVPVCWYTYYRVYGNGIGRKTFKSLITSRSASKTEVSLQGDTSS